MRSLALSSLVLLAVGCRHAVVLPPVPPDAAIGDPAAAALVPSAPDGPRDPTPLSIKRLLAEERVEIDDVLTLTAPLTDVRGRARAQREAEELSAELIAIGEAIAAEGPDSQRYDEAVLRLQRLATRVSLMHEALRGAVSDKTALQTE